MAKISMEVVALSDYCKNCPELEIEVETAQYTYHGQLYEQDFITEYKNTLACKHYGRCLEIKNFVESKEKSQEKHGL